MQVSLNSLIGCTDQLLMPYCQMPKNIATIILENTAGLPEPKRWITQREKRYPNIYEKISFLWSPFWNIVWHCQKIARQSRSQECYFREQKSGLGIDGGDERCWILGRWTTSFCESHSLQLDWLPYDSGSGDVRNFCVYRKDPKTK